MLKDRLRSFINKDTKLTKKVHVRDDILDMLSNHILSELTTFVASDLRTIERSNHLIRILRNLERTIDLSTDISEDVNSRRLRVFTYGVQRRPCMRMASSGVHCRAFAPSMDAPER